MVKKRAQWQKWCRVCHLKCRKQERTGKKCYLLMHFDDVQTGKCTLSVSSIIHFGAMIYSAASFYHSTVHYPNLVPRHPLLCPPLRHYQIPHGGPLERASARPPPTGYAVPTLSTPLSFRLRWHYEPHYLASTHHPHVLHFVREWIGITCFGWILLDTTTPKTFSHTLMAQHIKDFITISSGCAIQRDGVVQMNVVRWNSKMNWMHH